MKKEIIKEKYSLNLTLFSALPKWYQVHEIRDGSTKPVM